MSADLPLSGKRIVVTRAEEQADSVVMGLEKFGARALRVPVVRITPARLSADDIEEISSFAKFDAVVFTSVNAVKAIRSIVKIGRSENGKPFVVAVGKTTAKCLEDDGVVPDFVPGKSGSGEMLNSLMGFDWKGKRVLIPKGNLSGNEIAEFVSSRGGVSSQVVVYNTMPNDSLDERMKDLIKAGEFDAVVFFSPSQVENFVLIFGANVLAGKEVAVIGPTTKISAEKAGLAVNVVPETSTSDDLIASLIEYEKN